MCLSMLDDGVPNIRRHFIYATIKEEKRCSEERDDFNGRQQGVAFEGKVSPEAPVWPVMKWKMFSWCLKFISIRNVSRPERNLLFLGSVTVLFQLSWKKCKSHCPVIATSGSSILFLQKLRQNALMGLQFPLYASHTLQPPDTVCIWGLIQAVNSWDKYIKSTLISLAVSVGCGIVHSLPRIDCSFAFSCQTTVSFYIRQSHISLMGKIIHDDINRACGSNRITYFSNSNSLISPVSKRPHGVCAVLSFE